MSEKNKFYIFARYLSGECTVEQEKMVREWMQRDQILKQTMKILQKVWNVKGEHIPQEDINIAWQRMKSQIELKSQEKKKWYEKFTKRITWYQIFSFHILSIRRGFQFATVFILILCGSLILFHNYQNSIQAPQVSYQMISVEKGHKMNIDLNDGTHITLDAGSELKYPTEFKGTREVYLKGEAYFEVAHDKKRPFHVHANHALIRVLGTKFNIRAWKENPTVGVTVSEGKVALSPQDEITQSTVFISKGYHSTLAQKGLPSTPVKVNVDRFPGWISNEIHFQDANVKEVLAQLERWYDYKFENVDTSVLEHRITVNIRKTNIDNVLELISVITDTEITKNGKNIKIELKQ